MTQKKNITNDLDKNGRDRENKMDRKEVRQINHSLKPSTSKQQGEKTQGSKSKAKSGKE